MATGAAAIPGGNAITALRSLVANNCHAAYLEYIRLGMAWASKPLPAELH
jgi:hypothetical protein